MNLSKHKWIFLCLMSITFAGFAGEAIVIDHNELRSFSNNGNTLTGLATVKLGTTQYEVWKSSIAPGSCTTKHSHETEEIFIFLTGKGKAVVGGEDIFYEAPCTLVLPAGVEHQIFNTGDEPADHFAILGSGSKIVNAEGNEMHLPWR